jgi:WD40 repeat protein
MAVVPAVDHRYLGVVHFHEEGGLFLAASNLSGRNWAGSLWYFDNADSAPRAEFCSAGVQLEGGINDFDIVNDSNVFVGLDTGAVQIWSLSEERAELTRMFSAMEHDDLVTSVSVNSQQPKGISASQDRRIKLWDVNELVSTHTYKAHSSSVTGLAFHPNEPDIFVSCSLDGKILIWDMRKSKPARVLAMPPKSRPTCLAWSHAHTDQVFVGHQDGRLSFHDVKAGSQTLASIKVHSRKVNCIQCAPHRPEWVASASDDCRVCVTAFSETTGSVIFQNNDHKDFVRGLAWNPVNHRLFTCGWDFKVQGLEVVPNVESSPTRSEAMDLDVNMDAVPENIDSIQNSVRQMAVIGAGN